MVCDFAAKIINKKKSILSLKLDQNTHLKKKKVKIELLVSEFIPDKHRDTEIIYNRLKQHKMYK